MRSYQDEDLPDLQAALAGWILAAGWCGYCHPGDLAHRIYAGLRGKGPRGELVQVWEDGGGVAGVAICGRFDAAFDLFAAPLLRGGETELMMLRAASDTTRRHLARLGRPGEKVLSDVFSCDTRRTTQLARLGFAEYRRWDDITERDLAAPIPAPQLPPGWAIRPAALADHARLAAAHDDAFGDGWTPEQYRDEVMLRPGYDPGRELLVVAPGGAVAAFTIIWLDERTRVGLFEPVGTCRAFQRMGLARALMLHALELMRQSGMAIARVEHDMANAPAGALYRGLGFVKRYETVGYRR